MKTNLVTYRAAVKSDLSSIRKFNSQITFLLMSINKAITELETLPGLIAHYEKMLPIWKENLILNKKSLKLHHSFLEKHQLKYELAKKIEHLQKKIRILTKEL